ncbi:hypothetical protein VP01_1811g1 [Puccinia sorghi]|uniref:HAT C-terminal dimerisation domain-containing protein n=1 Tax=Puccinia sorghi TaxID=27349 RepID=A0A0L6VEQ5_9BASI|nr:hypothetical protein VP01_1811g1 [Puccinia sorghi]
MFQNQAEEFTASCFKSDTLVVEIEKETTEEHHPSIQSALQVLLAISLLESQLQELLNTCSDGTNLPYAVSASSTPCERAFSIGRHIQDYSRNRMKMKTLESIICLQNWIDNGVITMSDSFLKADLFTSATAIFHFFSISLQHVLSKFIRVPSLALQRPFGLLATPHYLEASYPTGFRVLQAQSRTLTRPAGPHYAGPLRHAASSQPACHRGGVKTVVEGPPVGPGETPKSWSPMRFRGVLPGHRYQTVTWTRSGSELVPQSSEGGKKADWIIQTRPCGALGACMMTYRLHEVLHRHQD